MNNDYPVFQSVKAIARRFALLLLLCIAVSGEVRAQLPPNIDFSLGNFNNWLCYTGYAVTGTPATGPFFSGGTLSGPVANRHTLMTGTGADLYGGFPVVAPAGGTYSLKIGNNSIGAEAERVRYFIHVPVGTTKFSLLYQFAVVLEDPGHSPEDQPSYQAVAYDSATGAIIPSANNLYIAGPGLPGFVTSSSSSGVICLSWTPNTLNLSGMGGKTVILEVTSSDCAPTGHFGYGYFDATSVSNYLAPVVVNCNLSNSTIKLQAPPGYKYYQWYNQSFSTALNSATDTSRTLTLPMPATAQYYNLILIPYAASGTPDTVRTNVLSGFTIATTPGTICVAPGSPTVLHTTVTGGTGSYTYQWTGASTLDSFNIPNPTATPIVRSTYVVKVSDTNGCFRMDTVRLNIGSYHVTAGHDTTTCLGTAVHLNGSVTPASSGYSYTWTPAGNLSATSTLSPTFTPSAVGTQQYILRVDSGTCSLYDTVNIRTLTNTFFVSDTAVCAGTTVMPTVLGDTAFTYTWSPSGRLTFPSPATTGSDQHPAFAADTTTTFTITAHYPGCPDTARQLTVHVEPWPVVSLGSDTVYKSMSSPISISTSVAPGWFSAYAYEWNQNSFIDSIYNAHISFSGATDTLLVVTVRTPAGCTGSDSVRVIIGSQLAMSVPNAFTPGNALNRTFKIVYVQPGYTLRSFRIYNRWGKQMYETGNINEGWDGNFRGTAQPLGVYVYVLEAVSATGKHVTQQGSVTLIR